MCIYTIYVYIHDICINSKKRTKIRMRVCRIYDRRGFQFCACALAIMSTFPGLLFSLHRQHVLHVPGVGLTLPSTALKSSLWSFVYETSNVGSHNGSLTLSETKSAVFYLGMLYYQLDLGMAVDPPPPPAWEILATIIYWYYNAYATKWDMLALWEV